MIVLLYLHIFVDLNKKKALKKTKNLHSMNVFITKRQNLIWNPTSFGIGVSIK